MKAEERSGLVRTLLLSVTAAAAVAMVVYAFAPSSGDDDLGLSRPVKRLPGASAAPTEKKAAAAPEVAAEAFVAPDPSVVPSASTVPAGSPFAVDVRGGAGAANKANAKAPPTPPTSAAAKVLAKTKPMRFGAAQVSQGKRFNLRMSAPIKAIDGAADASGFSVIAHGGLALDRAGPISSALPVVRRSMIINKGDRAELTIRFHDGKQPAYQVTADGNVLSVVIQDL
jgi:hypothetical protein